MPNIRTQCKPLFNNVNIIVYKDFKALRKIVNNYKMGKENEILGG